MSFAEKLSKCKKNADRGKTENRIEMHFGIIVGTIFGWGVGTRGVSFYPPIIASIIME